MSAVAESNAAGEVGIDLMTVLNGIKEMQPLRQPDATN